MGKGKFDLSLRRIREIRGYSGRYGNCLHGNQRDCAGDLTGSGHYPKIFYSGGSPGRPIGSAL